MAHLKFLKVILEIDIQAHFSSRTYSSFLTDYIIVSNETCSPLFPGAPSCFTAVLHFQVEFFFKHRFLWPRDIFFLAVYVAIAVFATTVPAVIPLGNAKTKESFLFPF